MLGNVSFKQSFKAPVSTYKSSRLLFIHVLKQFDKRSKHVHAESGMGDPDPTLPLLFSRQSHVLNFCLSIFLNATFFPVLHPVQRFGVNPTSWAEVKSCILSINLHFPESQIPDLKNALPDLLHGGDQFDLKSNFINLLFKKEMSRVQSEEFISGYCGLSASVWTVRFGHHGELGVSRNLTV